VSSPAKVRAFSRWGDRKVNSETDDLKSDSQRVYAAEIDRDVDYLVQALTDPEVRRVAARALANIADVQEIIDARVVTALQRLLMADEPHARAAAVQALGKLHASEVSDDVTRLARQDQLWWVRTWAIAAVAELDSADAADVLLACLDESDFRIRRAALRGLQTLGDPGSVDALKAAKRRERWYRRGLYRQTIRLIRGRSR
jgi:HEAT repeat protein